MRRLSLLLALLLVAPAVFAGPVEHHLDPVPVDLGDKASLQRGARIFVNYCLSCHSAAYMRYNRMGRDLDISEDDVRQNLLFAADRVGDLMKAVMPRDDARLWFGTAPPDLTLVARAHTPEWVYTYMRSFYRDDKSPSGWNNIVFPNVAMPHVLYEWQGDQRAVFKLVPETVRITHSDGTTAEKVVEHMVFDKFVVARQGTMTPEQYNEAMRDLTNFLVYLGEPAKLVRYEIGAYVLGFLAILLVFAYLLKKEYWKDVH